MIAQEVHESVYWALSDDRLLGFLADILLILSALIAFPKLYAGGERPLTPMQWRIGLWGPIALFGLCMIPFMMTAGLLGYLDKTGAMAGYAAAAMGPAALCLAVLYTLLRHAKDKESSGSPRLTIALFLLACGLILKPWAFLIDRYNL